MKQAPLPLWRLTTAVSATGLVAAAISFFALFVITPPRGCASGMSLSIILGFTVIFGVASIGLGALIGAGAFLAYGGSRLGPYLMATANLPVIGFFGWWDPVGPGQVVWGWTVVAFSCLPLLALLLSAVQLFAAGLSGHLAVAFLTLLSGALLLPYLIGHGWVLDLGYAYQSPPQPAGPVASRC